MPEKRAHANQTRGFSTLLECRHGKEAPMFQRHLLIVAAILTATLVSGSYAAAAEPVPAEIAAAVADESRPDSDRQRDANRKPAEVVAFAGISKGDRVAD